MSEARAGSPLEQLRAGGRRAISQALAEIEAAPENPPTRGLLEQAWRQPRAHVIGLTGPPGVGKSTLLSGLIAAYRRAGRTVGAIAVDPSSRRSGGALLGDRMRLDLDDEDRGVYVRSMAARERLGGLAALTEPAVVLMRAVFDRVIVETVGIGQSETDVGAVVDTVILCVQPGSGDSIQFMKAGIAELPDIAVVNKADLGVIAEKAKGDLESALALDPGMAGRGWKTPVLKLAAAEGRGLDTLVETADRHAAFLETSGEGAKKRHAQAQAWIESTIREAFGRRGLERAAEVPGGLALAPDEPPFARLQGLIERLGAGTG